jgi:uncharacterized protein
VHLLVRRGRHPPRYERTNAASSQDSVKARESRSPADTRQKARAPAPRGRVASGVSLELLEWRRRVADLYAAARAAGPGVDGWTRWRAGREKLFVSHPQSPLAAGAALAWFPFDATWRLEADVEPAVADRWRTAEGDFHRIGTAVFSPPGASEPARLAVWWLEAYAGGLFVPFRDATADSLTYGGGRYLLDSAKGADLGSAGDRLVLDFNYAYNPSCAYDARWPCPLAPEANRLALEVRAGEQLPSS